MSEEFKIDITKPFEDFTKHLNLEDNERIIFSGIFGIGKTYFLREYFENFKNDYLTIRLSPINYSIASNEDIFRFIKYDILYEILINKDFVLKDGEDFSKFILNYYYITSNFSDILKVFIQFIPEIGKDTREAIENAQKLYKEYKEFTKGTKGRNQKEIEKFTSLIEKSYLYEYDDISDFIEKTLSKLAELKSKENPRKKVLIIDDMDRIDPEHIFRLFNVFSAHFDYRNESDNKFGFDKIIFVCDINNIRNIFKTKYGQDTDFSGYIDKFYSREIYYFDNKKNLSNIIDTILKSIKITENHQHLFKDLFSIISEILVSMIYANAINIRNLFTLYEKEFSFQEKKIIPFKIHDMSVLSWQMRGVRILEVLLRIFGDVNNLINAIKKTAEYREECKVDRYLIHIPSESKFYLGGDYVLILDNQKHKFVSFDKSFKFKSKLTNNEYEYEIKIENGKFFFAKITNVDGSEETENTKYYFLLLETAQLLKEMGVLE